MPQGPMTCPVDGATLTMTDRSGIEIDYCPTCRGVWLDRGELDKIIERNAQSMAPQPAAPPQHNPQQYQSHPQESAYGHDPHYRGHKPYKRRKSFLEELFD